ncbi:type II secretion system major pseudopilin GspG [Candidatus Omnitrophota bacterium]
MRIKTKKGFTFVELMVVIVILVILAATAVPRLVGRTDQARIAAASADIEANIATALALYELDNGRYPTTEQGLQALVTEPTSSPVPSSWNGPYLKKKRVPKDPWGKLYVYVQPGVHNEDDYDLYSLGPDGIEGGGDDVSNWEEFTGDDE